jgi:hypothetical protein
MPIRHLVLFRFKPQATAAEVDAIVQAFGALRAQIAEILAFEWGRDISPEGLGRGYTHCFQSTFADAPARDRYLVHPAHQAFVARLRPSLDEALVVDYAVSPDDATQTPAAV